MKFKKKLKFNLIVGIIAILLVLVSCESIVSNSGDNSGTGSLSIKVTDAPFPAEMVAEANVAVNKVEIRRRDTDSSGFETIFQDSVNFNLVDLQNGVTQTLVNADLKTGNYDLVRIYIYDANIVLDNGEQYDLKVPSGAASGLKVFINPQIKIEGGLSKDLLLDFDISKSFVARGNINSPAGVKGFIFKPVVRAANLSTAGRVAGIVSDTSDSTLSKAKVWIEKDTVISTTYSNSEGEYALIGISEGNYILKAYKDGYDTLTIDPVEITASNETTQDIQLK